MAHPWEDGVAKGLVAFIETSQSDVSMQTVEKAVKSHLPRYMWPGRFILVDEILKNENGKFDRNALLAGVNGEE